MPAAIQTQAYCAHYIPILQCMQGTITYTQYRLMVVGSEGDIVSCAGLSHIVRCAHCALHAAPVVTISVAVLLCKSTVSSSTACPVLA